MQKAKALTAIFMGILAIAILVYDVIMISMGDILFGEPGTGKEASISNVLNEYFYSPSVHPLMSAIFGLIVGGLMVHFLAWKPINCHITEEEICNEK